MVSRPFLASLLADPATLQPGCLIRVGRQHNPRRTRWERGLCQVCNITGSACLPQAVDELLPGLAFRQPLNPYPVYPGVPGTDNLPEAPRQNLNGIPDGLLKVNGSRPVCTSLYLTRGPQIIFSLIFHILGVREAPQNITFYANSLNLALLASIAEFSTLACLCLQT